MDLNSEIFRDWLPGRLYFENERPVVDWVYAGEVRLSEPFYDDTLEICQRRPFSQLFRHQTPLDGSNVPNDAISPTGFIFHVSRCGSTLVSQMLARLDSNIVVSEAPIIDKVIRAEASEDERIRWLRTVIGIFGRRRREIEKHLFIKFDCWTSLDLGLVLRAFPETPWIFVYRNPVEVMVSNMREPGAQMIPGAIKGLFPGMDLNEILLFSKEERCGRAIGSFFRAGLENSGDAKGLLVNYSQLPDAVFDPITDHFGISFDANEIDAMMLATGFHAKSQQGGFSPDGEKKRAEASAEVVRFASELVDPLYEQLEKVRLKAGRNAAV